MELLLESAGILFIKVLENIGDEEKQAKKNKQDRLTPPQPFIVDGEMKQKLKRKKIILVDDLYTTGRTMFHAYDAIKTCQPKDIQTFSLFR
ncbi:hypothetical protein AKA01nite_01080 [Alkalibacterium kapii]|uniref:Phosphoribosyltransferase domain-containing protein n=1 Tax=Alkalibacterium kapii TaxID=426704 RepID=A0A511AQX8_9LACT|nr:hypothetical protein AKA01nite_01080 [Alkalibacterium kapii]